KATISCAASLPGWLGWPPREPEAGGLNVLRGMRWNSALVLDASVHSVLDAMLLLFLLLLLRIFLRREWLAGIGMGAILIIPVALHSDYPVLTSSCVAVGTTLFAFLLIRFGLLAGTVTFFVFSINDMVLTYRLDSWYV